MADEKIVKNTTGLDIELGAVGIPVPANDQYIIEIVDYLLWASEDAIVEITPFINSGDLVINDGTSDLTAAEGIRFLEYADRAYIEKDGTTVTKVNKVLNFEGFDVTDNGSGKTTITSKGDSDFALYKIKCTQPGSCIVTTEVSALMNQDLCFIKKVDC